MFSLIFLAGCGSSSKTSSNDLKNKDIYALDQKSFQDAELESEGIENEFSEEMEGEYYEPIKCKKNSDCESGLCLIIDYKNFTGVCTYTCTSDSVCPQDWTCVTVTLFGDPLAVCVPPVNKNCDSCKTDAECFFEGYSCVLIDEKEGNVCLKQCGEGGQCPDGYECGNLDGKSLCSPHSGSCSCSEITGGQKRYCFNENSSGKCEGFETCDPEKGWSECSAKIPSDELCNGIDDNCDNQIDENMTDKECFVENGFGKCTGVESCKGVLGWLCDAETPKKEVCDSDDNDCDGWTDEEDAVGCKIFFKDEDKDSFGVCDAKACFCEKPEFYSDTCGDCDDKNSIINPSIEETCNGIDDNCNNAIDEGCKASFSDIIQANAGGKFNSGIYRTNFSFCPSSTGGRAKSEKYKLDFGFFAGKKM
jgi:hypothetical protein